LAIWIFHFAGRPLERPLRLLALSVY
jgi:hypothetical protein